MSEWISVKDRLPDNDEVVLVSTASPKGPIAVFTAYYWPYESNAHGDVKNAWQNCDLDGIYQLNAAYITHWMPLPAPPEAA